MLKKELEETIAIMERNAENKLFQLEVEETRFKKLEAKYKTLQEKYRVKCQVVVMINHIMNTFYAD